MEEAKNFNNPSNTNSSQNNLNITSPEKTLKEMRIRKITQLYYSRPEIKKILFEFSQNREICPRYFEGFGKRPDSFQYISDVFELVKKGATSFHCSEEIWSNPLNIETGMPAEKLNELRTGWDLLIDIDSKYLDYSKVYAEIILNFLKFHGIKNPGIKFSGSKGFHIIIPWKGFPEEVNGIKTSDMFPEWARIIAKYIAEKTKKQLIEKISNISRPNQYIKDFEAPKEVIPDLVLVSPRHLFRMPYSLHEKTALASVVLDLEEDNSALSNFQPRDADPFKIKIRNFIPEDVRRNEAAELLTSGLDWNKENKISSSFSEKEKKVYENKEQIKLENLSEENFPPCIKKILKGLTDGQNRSLFALINLFRSVGMDKDELEKRIYEWNEKNNPKLREGIIQTQILWNFRRKPLLPPNCKEFYQGLGVCQPDILCNTIKNPTNYVIKKNLRANWKPEMKNNSKNKKGVGKK